MQATLQGTYNLCWLSVTAYETQTQLLSIYIYIYIYIYEGHLLQLELEDAPCHDGNKHI